MRCEATMPDGKPCNVFTGRVFIGTRGPKEYPEPVCEYEKLCEFHKNHTNADLPKNWRRI